MLLQGGTAQTVPEEIFFWLGVLVALCVVIGLVGWLLYRRHHRSLEEPAHISGFTLADLRRMHREGQLDDEEFAQAKKLLLATDPMLAAVRESAAAKRNSDHHHDASEDDPGDGSAGGAQGPAGGPRPDNPGDSSQ